MASSSSEPNLNAEGYGGGDCATSAVGDGGSAVREVGGESLETVVSSDQLLLYRGVKKAKKERTCTAKERISKMPPCAAGKRSSIYRGVTRHRWTGRFEAHLWDKSSWNQNQNKKGKQVYLGAYDEEEAAARAYDLAALKYWGPVTLINFPVTDYARDVEEMQNVSREEYLTSLRRKSSAFSRGISKHRGLSRWESPFGRIPGTESMSEHYGDEETVADDEYMGDYRVERKINLTSYMKWLCAFESHQPDLTKSSEDKKSGRSEDISSELKSLEWAVLPTEPYQMPQLGTFQRRKSSNCRPKTSAMGILSQSAAYKSFQEKILKKKNSAMDDNSNDKEGKDNMNILEDSNGLGKVESVLSLPLQQDMFPLLSAPLLNNYTTIESSADPVVWSSLGPVLSPDLPPVDEVAKPEAISTYTIFGNSVILP